MKMKANANKKSIEDNIFISKIPLQYVIKRNCSEVFPS